MTKTVLFLVIIQGLILLNAPGTACQQAQQTRYYSDTLAAELDDLVPNLLIQTGVPAVSIAVIRNGEVVLTKAYGLADKSTNTRVTPETKFQVGSVSKTVTAMAIVKLAEEGKINLDDPIEDHLKSWHLPIGKNDNRKVTIRMVLSHTAGLSVKGYHGVFKPGEKLPTLQESLNGYEGSDGALHLINEPGTSFEYSSGGFTLLQLLLQDVTGLSFADYVSQKLFVPLQLKNSSYDWPAVEKNVATPYNEEGRPWPHYQYIESGSGGLYTTASDLAKLLTLLCHKNNRKDQFKAATFLQMTEASKGTRGNYGMGCKIFLINEDQKMITHDGANEGWRAAYYIHPATSDGIVIMTNSDGGGKVGAPIMCTVFKGTAVDLSKLCSQLPK